ncbi:hypothetical protein L3Q82_004846 [Scortum barcoo]|uniref:Uncharacterized protein n=1 Tax=Scortum barcoo TaxID=214431 RepID=A0ACB8VE74_9TELE|nr:hypothetical protein L3Q82_004846 [Scortum barcoo]
MRLKVGVKEGKWKHQERDLNTNDTKDMWQEIQTITGYKNRSLPIKSEAMLPDDTFILTLISIKSQLSSQIHLQMTDHCQQVVDSKRHLQWQINKLKEKYREEKKNWRDEVIFKNQSIDLLKTHVQLLEDELETVNKKIYCVSCKSSHQFIKLLMFADDTTLIGLIFVRDESAYSFKLTRKWFSYQEITRKA